MITFQITRISETHSLRKQDLSVLNHIQNFVEEQKKVNPSSEEKEKPDEEIAKKKISSQGSSPKTQTGHIELKESALIPIKKLFSNEKRYSLGKSEKGLRSSLKNSISPRWKKDKDDKKEKSPEDPQLTKLEHQSQFKQRTQIKKITNILKQSHAENAAIKKLELAGISENSKEQEISPLAGFRRKNKKSSSNVENFLRKKNSIQSGGGFELQILPIEPPTLQHPGEKNNKREPKLENLVKSKEMIVPEPMSMVSNHQPSEELIGSSENIEQLFYHKTVNFGAQKIDEYYEILDELPAIRTMEGNYSALSVSRSSKGRYSSYSKYRTLNDDLDEMAQTDSALESFLLKVHRLWLSVKKNSNSDTVLEFQQEIAIEYAASSQINLVIYSMFNALISFFWIIVNKEMNGFTGFFATRLVIVATALLAVKMWKSPHFCEFHRTYIYVFYGAIAINILVFTLLNPYIGIVMEMELVACYISITKFPIIGFLEAIGMSIAFLVLHIIYLRIVENPYYLMLHSSVVVILFNLAAVHLKVKTIIDNFNKGRINFIKKKQLNNLIVNLLPNHVILSHNLFDL